MRRIRGEFLLGGVCGEERLTKARGGDVRTGTGVVDEWLVVVVSMEPGRW